MVAGAFPTASATDPLVKSMADALAAIEVIGPDEDGLVILRLTATWGARVEHSLGRAGHADAADAWLAWRDLLA